MREFARKFYKSKAWKTARNAYIEQVRFCEKCMERGFYVPAEIVHHKEHLTPANINDPSVSIAFGNLEALCRKCHAEMHPEIYGWDEKPASRVAFDADGNVIRKD